MSSVLSQPGLIGTRPIGMRSTQNALDRPSRAWCLAAGLSCALPLLRLLPWWLALILLAVGVGSATLTWFRPAPAALRLLFTLGLFWLVLAVYGYRFGRDTGSALLLAMLLLKPIELKTLRDARSLVGFGLFALFAAFLLDQGPLTLTLAIPAAVLAFAACAQMADNEVGLPLQGIAFGTAGLQRVLAVLGLFGLAAPLALAAFWLFPRLDTPLWGIPNVAKAKVGISERMAPGDWLDILVDDTPAFRVKFDGALPPRQQLYWRGLVLWNFDGRGWTRPDWPRSLPPAPTTPGAAAMGYRVTLEPTDRPFLFALDLPKTVPDAATLAQDYSLAAREPISSLHSYNMVSAPPARFEPDLPDNIRAVALRLPHGYNPRTIALARQWRADGADDAAMIRRALAMYHDNFSYTLAAPPLGRDSVDEFLFDTRQGFCEHFSSSFTFLMRAAGIPARVVTGYVGAYRNPIGDYWLVKQSDAHAWSEVWLAGRGWVRIDPTAAVRPERVFGRASNAVGGDGPAGTVGQLFDLADWARRGWNDFVLGFNSARQQSLLASIGLHDADARQLAALFGAVVGALLFGITLLQLRRRGPRPDPLLRAWARFTARLAQAHLRKRPDEPALAFARRVAALLPAQGEEILALSRRFTAARYARDKLDSDVRVALAKDLQAFRVRPRTEH